MSDMPRLLESPEFSSFCIFAPELGEPRRLPQQASADQDASRRPGMRCRGTRALACLCASRDAADLIPFLRGTERRLGR